VDVSVYFDELELNTGGRASGYVQIPGGKKYPFQGVIPPAPMCGWRHAMDWRKQWIIKQIMTDG